MIKSNHTNERTNEKSNIDIELYFCFSYHENHEKIK
jgi:hypothetical protein